MDEQSLRQYFKFDEADLEANRNGYLSEKQQAARKKLELGSTGRVLVITLAMVILIAAMWPIITAMRNSATTSLATWGTAAFWMIVGVAVDIWLLRRMIMQGKYHLARVEGVAKIVTTSGERNSTYYDLQIGGLEFGVDEGITDAIVDGQSYVIYYVKPNNEIVSAEVSSKSE